MLSLLMMLAAAPQDPATAPVKLRYRFASTMEMTMDMSAMMASMGAAMGRDSTRPMPTMPAIPPVRSSVTFTLSSKDSAGGRSAHIVVDSVEGGMMASLMSGMSQFDSLPKAERDSMKAQMNSMLGPMMKSAQGESLDIFAVPGKQMVVNGNTSGSPDMAMIVQALTLLFPPMKLGTTVGQTWTDTTSADTLVSSPVGLSATPKTQTITNWKMITREAYEGDVTSTVSVNMDALGTTEGTSTGKTRVVLDKNRYVVEAGASTSMLMSMKDGLFGGGAKITQNSTVSLTRIK